MKQLILEPHHLKIVKAILEKNIPNQRVIIFGSRVTGKAKPHSDLDLCVIGEHPLSLKKLADLNEDFSESNLPIRVDIVDWTSISSSFQSIILNNYIDL